MIIIFQNSENREIKHSNTSKNLTMIIILKSSSIEVLLIAEVVQICQTLSFSNQDNCLEPSLSFPAKGWISSNLAFLPLIGRQGDDRTEFAEICLPGKSSTGAPKNLFVRKTIGEICLPDNFSLEESSSAGISEY